MRNLILLLFTFISLSEADYLIREPDHCSDWGRRDTFAVVLEAAQPPYGRMAAFMDGSSRHVNLYTAIHGQRGDTARFVVDMPAFIDDGGIRKKPAALNLHILGEHGQYRGRFVLCMGEPVKPVGTARRITTVTYFPRYHYNLLGRALK